MAISSLGHRHKPSSKHFYLNEAARDESLKFQSVQGVLSRPSRGRRHGHSVAGMDGWCCRARRPYCGRNVQAKGREGVVRDVRLAVDVLPQHKIWSTQNNWFSSSTAGRYRLHLIEQVTSSHNPKNFRYIYLKHNDIIDLPILKCTLES